MGKLTKIFKKKNKASFPAEVDAGSPVNETLQSNDSAKTSSENASQLPTNSLEKATGHSAPLMNEAEPGSASAIVREDIENAPFETSKKGNEKKGSSFAAKLISKIGKAFSSEPKEKDPEKQRRKHYLEKASSERDSITALGTYVSYDNLSYDKALQFQYFLDEASSKLDSTRVLSPSDSAESLFTADTNVINSQYVPDVSLTAYSTRRDSISSASSEVSDSVYSAYINNAPIYDVLKDVSLTASKNVEEQSSTSKNVKDKSSASKDVEEKPSSSKKNSSALKRMSNALKKIKFTGPLTKSTKNGTTMNNNPQNKTSAQSSSSEPLYDVPKASKSKFYVDLPTEQNQTSPIQSPTTSSSSEPLYYEPIYEPLNYAYHPIPFKANTEHKSVSPVASPAPSRSSSSSSLDSTTSSKSAYYPTPFKTNTTHKPVSAVTSPTPNSSASSEPLYDVPKQSKSKFYVELPTEQKQTSPIQSPTPSSSSEPLHYEPIYEPLNYAYHPIPFKANTEHKSVSPVSSPALSRSSSSSSLDSTTSSKSAYYPTPFKASTESGSTYKPVSAVASPTPSSSTLESKPATSPEPKSWKKAGSVTGAVKVKAAAFESHAQSDSEIESKSVAPLKPKRGMLLSDSIQHSAQGNLSATNSVKSVASSHAQEEHGAQKKELPSVLKKFSDSSHIAKLEGMFANAGPSSSKPVAVASSPKVVNKEAPALHSAAASTSLSESA
ncbi:hypothetical protein, partial [Anaplasma phagocytophilum]|uniref:hypothetical protein n=1 Tax=Anaplasma phagocytophilum TaxID=948 RepID=UPI000ADC0DDC